MRIKLQKLFLLLLALPALPACQSNREDEPVSFSMSGSQLLRDRQAFDLRAVQIPGLVDPLITLAEQIRRLNEACAAGANSVVVNLAAVNPEGSQIDHTWLTSFNSLVAEASWRSMGVVLRVPVGSTGHERLYPPRIATTLSDKFSGRSDFLLWLDGPESHNVSQAVRSGLQGLVVVTDSGGDLSIVREPGTMGSGGAAVAIGRDPAQLLPSRHFVLLDSPDALARLEEAFRQVESGQNGQKDPHTPAGLPDAEGFLPLFDGKTLEGWVVTGDPGSWIVREGAIERVGDGGGVVRSRQRFANFVLRFDWKITKNGNSGVFLRAPRAGRASRIGMEFQLLGDFGQPPHKNGTGSIYDLVAPAENASRPAGEWNSVQISFSGSRLKAEMNGRLLHDLDLGQIPGLEDRLKEGFIALQDHGALVAFRNLRVKPLASASAGEAGAAPKGEEELQETASWRLD